MRVESCYVHPVKGMTPTAVESLALAAGQSPAGDRAFVFAFADAELRGDAGWVHKHDVISCLSVPSLPELTASYDVGGRVLTLGRGEERRTASVDDAGEREALAGWLADVVRSMPKHPLHEGSGREPLRLLGDGTTLFTDRGPTQVSIGSLASLGSLGAAAGAEVDMRRFRMNLVIDGEEAWEEFGWVGKRVQVGEALLEVTAPLRRCKAVNANPSGGGRDINLLDVLEEHTGHLDFGVEANVVEGGIVQAGDAITVLDG